MMAENVTEENGFETTEGDTPVTEGLSVDDALEKVVLYAFDEASQKLEQCGIVEPFTILIEGENLYVESHPGDDVAECFDSARKTVFEMTNMIDAYVFCYDGYIELDEGPADALITESAKKNAEVGEAVALIYTERDGIVTFRDSLVSLGEAPTLFGAEVFDQSQLEEIGDESEDA